MRDNEHPSNFEKPAPAEVEKLLRNMLYAYDSLIQAIAGMFFHKQCSTHNLRTSIDLDRIFYNLALSDEWEKHRPALDGLGIPDGTGGVNPGDRRAIWYLTRSLGPMNVLEVGTHIGASTVHIASALRGTTGRLTTVDITDVNAVIDPPPLSLVERIGCRRYVEFIQSPSLAYLKSTRRQYDLIFLDGDHREKTVYQEIPAALDRLALGGIVLLHDYFPGLRPLWNNGAMIPGPYLAVERLAREGNKLAAVPLGSLPWPTKCGTSITSLAVLVRQ